MNHINILPRPNINYLDWTGFSSTEELLTWPDHILMKPFPQVKIYFFTNFFFNSFSSLVSVKPFDHLFGYETDNSRKAPSHPFLVLCLYLYSFLMAEQLKCTSIVFREGGYMKIKGWWPSLSLLRKDSFKNNIYDYTLTFIPHLYKTYLHIKKVDSCSHSKSSLFPLIFTVFREFLLSINIDASWFHAQVSAKLLDTAQLQNPCNTGPNSLEP